MVNKDENIHIIIIKHRSHRAHNVLENYDTVQNTINTNYCNLTSAK